MCDLAAGGGAFLLAAAAELAEAGLDRRHIVEDLLWGVDIDADAVAVCRRSLAAWAAEGGEEAEASHIVVGDGLAGLDAWPDSPAGGFDLVVGNPPFQSQLGRETARRPGQLGELRRRFGSIVSPYVDTAALFLVAASRAAADGGTVVLVLPESVLATRDAAAARAAVLEICGLAGFWWAGAHVFDAVVDVCAPVLRRGAVHAGDGAEVDGSGGGRGPTGLDPGRRPGRGRTLGGTAGAAVRAGVDHPRRRRHPLPAGRGHRRVPRPVLRHRRPHRGRRCATQPPPARAGRPGSSPPV